MTRPDDVVITSLGKRPEYKYYADRCLIFGVTGIAEFRPTVDELKDKLLSYYVTFAESNNSDTRALVGQLAGRKPGARVGSFIFFDLRGIEDIPSTGRILPAGLKQPE